MPYYLHQRSYGERLLRGRKVLRESLSRWHRFAMADNGSSQSACAAGFAFSTAAQACIQVQTDIFNWCVLSPRSSLSNERG